MVQLVIDLTTLQVLHTVYGKGHENDFGLYKRSKLHLGEQLALLADKGYQGIAKLHRQSFIPCKKPRGGKLTQTQRAYNRELAKLRIKVEHVIRRLKVFRILSERYRNRRRRFGLRFNLIASIYNCQLAQVTT
ncbi:MAG: transposase family protein [Cyanobacteria bacterium J06638_22]